MVQVGDKLPEFTFAVPGPDGPQARSTTELFGGKRAVLFAVPGAYTPTCHNNHLPGFLAKADALRGKGVETIACLSVNDPFVMKAWSKDTGAEGVIQMLADGSAGFTKAIGMELDLTERALGVRSRRYAMLLEDGIIRYLGVEEGREVDASSADAVLGAL